MKRQRSTTQMKEQTRNTEVQINEEEIGKLPEKEFRKMIIKMIKNLENKMEEMQESVMKSHGRRSLVGCSPWGRYASLPLVGVGRGLYAAS